LALWPDWASLSFYTLLGAASYAGFLFSLCPGLIREIRVNFSHSVADPGLTSVLKADIE
jgi:hypothetical protein